MHGVGEAAHASDGTHGEHGQRDDHAHFEHELDEVGPEHGPQTADGIVGKREGEACEDRFELVVEARDPQGEGEDLYHGEVHPAHDDGIDR